MIIMASGICHWFHSDVMYRLRWRAHVGPIDRDATRARTVGQGEGAPPRQTMADGHRLVAPPRQAPGASYWYAHTDHGATTHYGADKLASLRVAVRRRANFGRLADLGHGDGLEPVLSTIRIGPVSINAADEVAPRAATRVITSPNNLPSTSRSLITGSDNLVNPAARVLTVHGRT